MKATESYWSDAAALVDYMPCAMPFHAPQSLSNDQVYAESAYILYLNGIVPKDAVFDAESVAAVRMPNRDSFVSPDPRPNIRSEACAAPCQ